MTKRKTHPNRVELWFTDKDNTVIEKAAAKKGMKRKDYLEQLGIAYSYSFVEKKSTTKKTTKKK